MAQSSIPFTARFSTPHMLALSAPRSERLEAFQPADGRVRAARASGGGRHFLFLHKGVFPPPFVLDTPAALVVLLGNPIVGGAIDRPGACGRLFPSGGRATPESARSLNGEFTALRFDKADGSLQAVNDRFASYPLYYYSRGGLFAASQYFSDLWHWLDARGAARLCEASALDFLWFQRVLGVKTHAEGAFYLPSASMLELGPGGAPPAVAPHWRRSYVKSNRPLAASAEAMAALVRASVRRKTSDRLRYAHFLSGGMDSRTVLAAFEENLPVCFTATVSEDNREARMARRIARAKGAPHVHLRLDPEHYGRILDASVRCCGGMYNFDHGLFYGFDDAVAGVADAAFHGHGFDYMFQGMYIPRRRYAVGGRTLCYVTMAAPPADLAGHFISSVSYRVKGADIPSFLREGARAGAAECLRASVEEVLADARALSADPLDQWEHLTFHHISRHYSYPNHASVATYVQQRAVSFDNDLFDFYLSLPHAQRFDARVERACLKILDRRLAAIPSANTSYPITASCVEQTLHQIKDYVARRLRGFTDYEEWTQRTWPERPQALRRQEALRSRAERMCASGELARLPFVDAGRLGASVSAWLRGEDAPGVSGDLVQTLLSLSVFLSQRPPDEFKDCYALPG